ncbi:Ig-like domain-containing protein, partial [Anaerosporobacter sp.]|uniref:Ig-like domain-containing protein n=1 Tax=Anaerosporobacter sp. TaxID=1872529 RepID=UPI00286EF945
FVSAAYIGGSVEVGSAIDKNNVTVIAAYNDNSIAYVTDFTLSTSTIYSLGTNTVTVYYEGYTSTITITGVAKGSLTPTTPTTPTSSTTVISGSSSITTSTVTGGYQGVVFPKVSLTTETNFSTITAEIEEKVLASALSGKTIGNTNIFQLTLSGVSAQILTQLNRSNVNEVYVNISMPVQYYGRNDIQLSNISLDNTTLNRIKNSGKSVIIQYVGSSYSSETGKTSYTNPLCTLTIKGKEFNSTANSNVALRVTALDKDYQIESVVNQYLKSADRGTGTVVTLEQNGELDKFASIIVDVGSSLSKEKGDIVYVYGYNATTKKLEELPATKYTVDKNQDITIPVSTYSKYVILPEATNKAVTSLASRAKVSKSLTMAKGKSKQITITLPSQLTESSVKVTYKSSNTKIASVSKTGKVTGKKKGSAVITITITYGSISKKFTTPITVK